MALFTSLPDGSLATPAQEGISSSPLARRASLVARRASLVPRRASLGASALAQVAWLHNTSSSTMGSSASVLDVPKVHLPASMLPQFGLGRFLQL